MRIVMAAALLLLLVPLAAAAASNSTSDNMPKERSEEDMWRIFMEWTAEHGQTSEELGYDMFKHGLRDIDRQWHEHGFSAWSWDRERSEEETRRIFAEWKAWTGKLYSSIAHEEHRYALFQDELRQVDRHNAGYAIGIHSSAQGINHFSDLTMEEYSAVCCGYIPPGSHRSPAELRWLAEIRERLRLVYAPSSM